VCVCWIEGEGDRWPAMLTGVGMLEFEFIEEERSCFIFMGGTWMVI
jgi:hypothetical protein